MVTTPVALGRPDPWSSVRRPVFTATLAERTAPKPVRVHRRRAFRPRPVSRHERTRTAVSVAAGVPPPVVVGVVLPPVVVVPPPLGMPPPLPKGGQPLAV